MVRNPHRREAAVTYSDGARAYIRGLFRDEDDTEPQEAPPAAPEPTTGPVIPGQEQMPHRVEENPMRGFVRSLFE